MTMSTNPETLNLKSRGNYITAYLELPESHDVSRINLETVTLIVEGSEIYAEDFPISIGDYNNNGIQDLMLKFDRYSVQNACTETGLIEFTLKCKTYYGTSFIGSDDVIVIDKGKEHFSENQGSVSY